MDLKGYLPFEQILNDKIIAIYLSIKQNYKLGKNAECIEKIGKFVEAITRGLEFIFYGTPTPFEEEIKVYKVLEQLEQSPKDKYSDSERVLIPRALNLLYSFRNRRGGAHLKGISPLRIDATLIVAACDWIIAELLRCHIKTDEKEVERIINSLADKQIPLTEEFEGNVKILEPNLKMYQKILLILYKKHPSYVSTKDLKKWTNSNNIYANLAKLDKQGHIYRDKDQNIITVKGIKYIEDILNNSGILSQFSLS